MPLSADTGYLFQNSYFNSPAVQVRMETFKKGFIRIRLKSYDHNLIDKSTEKIIQTAKTTGALIAGPIPLPTRKSIVTVNRSPHVDKKSREQFETRIHKRLIDIHNSTPRTIDALIRIELPAGVDIEIKT